MPQAYYNAKAGVKKLTTETGAGQWGTALAFACAQFDLECEVWQVRASYDQKPYRRMMIETFGGTVHLAVGADPGRPAVLAEHPGPRTKPRHRDQRGGRGRRPGPDDHYALGSVLNHVLLHQTIIGEEAAAAEEGGREDARPAGRLHRWRLELRRPDVPVPAEKLAGRMARRPRRRADVSARRCTQGTLRPTTSATPPA